MTVDERETPAAGKLRILVVDDHPIVRKGLAQLIAHEPDIEMVGGTDNVVDALRQVAELHPDLVVVDMSLKESHGLELLAQIKAQFVDVRTLVWSMFDEKIYAERALRAVPWATSTSRNRTASCWPPSGRCWPASCT